MRKAARAGTANKKIEYWLSAGMHQLLRLAAKQYRRPANYFVSDQARVCIGHWRTAELCESLADKRVRALGRLDIAFACQPIKREQDSISRNAEMVGQLPGTWNVAAGPQLPFCYQLADLFADLFVQRSIAPGFNLERNLNGGWATNYGRGRETRAGANWWSQRFRYNFYITHLALQQLRRLRLVPSFFFPPVLSARLQFLSA